MGWEKHIIKRRQNPERLLRRLEENRPYVCQLANRLGVSAGIPSWVDDLIQEGLMGIVRADQRYKPRGTGNFLTYAKYWVLVHMQTWMDKNCRVVRLPFSRWVRGESFIYVELDAPVSSQAADDGENITYAEAIPAVNGVPSHEAEVESGNVAIGEALKRLSSLQETILRAGIMDGKTDAEVAQLLGIGRKKANRTKLKALRQLRRDRELREAVGLAEPLGKIPNLKELEREAA